ncbi:MAG TPA: endo-1,4-beta-xylanase [Armatimonadota bacterium]|nr:endo-1,4-beta-xylanase [Armatimonadota bacterium]
MRQFMAIFTNFLLVVCIVLAAAPHVLAQDLPNICVDPSFEGPAHPATATKTAAVSGEIAEGWEDNSGWADVAIQYALDRQIVQNGKVSQRVDVKAINGGAAQFVQPLAGLKQGHVYSVHMWLRAASSNTLIQVGLRQQGSPWAWFASKHALIGPQWQEVSCYGLMPYNTDVYLMLKPDGVGTYWVDNVSVTDVTNTASSAPAKQGNLLPNGSFEAGVTAGWSAQILGLDALSMTRVEGTDPQPTLDTTTAADGKQSIRIDVPAGMSMRVASPTVPFNYGRDYVGSVAVKASSDKVSVQLSLSGAPVHSWETIGTQWKRISIRRTLPYGQNTRFAVEYTAKQPVTIWIDAAQLEEAGVPSSAYQPAAPVELGLFAEKPGHIFFDNEKLMLAVKTGGNVSKDMRLRLHVEDILGDEWTMPDVSLPREKVEISLKNHRTRGMYRVTGRLVNAKGQELSKPVTITFARLPQPRQIAPEQSYFGVHIPLSPDYIAIARALGAHWVRVHDSTNFTKWPVAEPERDQFKFYDGLVDSARAAGLRILGMLDGCPLWGSQKPTATTGYLATYNKLDIPDAEQRWEQYVQAVVGHYQGKIDYWEVWNEPWGQLFFKGTPEEYGALMKSAYHTAKLANPHATILGVDTNNGIPQFTDRVLKTTGTDNYDLFTFHNYNMAMYGGPKNGMTIEVEKYRAAQQQYGTVKAIWGSEGGEDSVNSWYADDGDGLGARQQMAHIVRFDVSMMAAGVQKFFYYTLHHRTLSGQAGYLGLEHDRGIRPNMAARAVLASLVDGAQCLGRTEPTPGVDAIRFRQTDGSIISVYWSYDGADHQVQQPDRSRALDILGNPLKQAGRTLQVTGEPIYTVQSNR